MTASAKSWAGYEYIVSHKTSLQNQKKEKNKKKEKDTRYAWLTAINISSSDKCFLTSVTPLKATNKLMID